MDFSALKSQRKLSSLRKKDPKMFEIVDKKMNQILSNQAHSFKMLHHELKGVSRVHIGHFVIIFVINHNEKTVSFEDFDHHDNIYES